MEPVKMYVQIGLIALGFVCLFLGVSLLVWGAVQNNAQAGGDVGTAAWMKALSKVVDSFAKYFPNGVTKVGGFLCFLGIFLIGGAFYISPRTL